MTRVWHSGPPPFIGWWNANNEKDNGAWQWWDGCRWSMPILWAVRNVDFYAECPAFIDNVLIRWTDYWPENARVARIDPRVGGTK